MTFLSIVAIAVALAMDAFAVAVAIGVQLGKVCCRQVFRLAWHFGLFQAIMPIIGWCFGWSVSSYIEQYDHWVAFLLLCIVGAKMIKEAFFGDDSGIGRADPTKGMSLIFLSVATSVDALAVGLSLYSIDVSGWMPSCVIGLVAAFFTAFGMCIGSRVSSAKRLGKWAEVMGGIVLMAIAVNILRVHNAVSVHGVSAQHM